MIYKEIIMASKLNKSKGGRGRNTPKKQPRSRVNKSMGMKGYTGSSRIAKYKSNPGY